MNWLNLVIAVTLLILAVALGNTIANRVEPKPTATPEMGDNTEHCVTCHLREIPDIGHRGAPRDAP